MLLSAIFSVEKKMKWVNNKIVPKSGPGNYGLRKPLGVNLTTTINFSPPEF